MISPKSPWENPPDRMDASSATLLLSSDLTFFASSSGMMIISCLKNHSCLVTNFVEMFRMEFNQSNNGQSSKPLSVWPSKNGRISIQKWAIIKTWDLTIKQRVQNSCLNFIKLFSFLVPSALYLQQQQFGTRIYHFAWYLLHLGMVTLHCAWYLLHLAMFAFHFVWYLPRFGTSTSHLHGICYILVLQTFMWVSWGFL